MHLHHPNVEKKDMPPQSFTISKADAIKRTKNWREELCHLLDPQRNAGDGLEAKLPKCMFIKLEDIYQIVNDYLLAGITVSGIRLYFTLEDENAKKDFHVTGFIVPTKQTADEISGVHEDLIMEVPIANTTLTGSGTGYSIYDFTKPCPTYCSGTTPDLTGAP